MAWIVYLPPTPKLICWSSAMWYLRMWLYLAIKSLQMFLVKMRLLEWVSIQYAWCPYRKEKLGRRHAYERECHGRMEAEIRVLRNTNLHTTITPNPQSTLNRTFGTYSQTAYSSVLVTIAVWQTIPRHRSSIQHAFYYISLLDSIVQEFRQGLPEWFFCSFWHHQDP